MNHDEAALLSALIDGELSQDERARVESHLPGCASCRADLDGLRFMKARLARADRRAMPPDLIAGIEAAVARPWHLRWFPVLGRSTVMIPAGMVAAAGIIVGLWLGMTNNDPDQFIPLEPLLAAHARYEAEALLPEDNMVAARYSYQLANADGEDQQQ